MKRGIVLIVLSWLVLASPAYSWQEVLNTPTLAAVTTVKDNLVGAEANGNIWLYKDNHWIQIDNNPNTANIEAGSYLYQRHLNGSVWRWTGRSCNSSGCGGWEKLDNNPKTTRIWAAGRGQLFQAHNDGSLWEYTGQPCQENHCPGWRKLDVNANTWV